MYHIYVSIAAQLNQSLLEVPQHKATCSTELSDMTQSIDISQVLVPHVTIRWHMPMASVRKMPCHLMLLHWREAFDAQWDCANLLNPAMKNVKIKMRSMLLGGWMLPHAWN